MHDKKNLQNFYFKNVMDVSKSNSVYNSESLNIYYNYRRIYIWINWFR